jgi:hypothetical protein
MFQRERSNIDALLFSNNKEGERKIALQHFFIGQASKMLILPGVQNWYVFNLLTNARVGLQHGLSPRERR